MCEDGSSPIETEGLKYNNMAEVFDALQELGRSEDKIISVECPAELYEVPEKGDPNYNFRVLAGYANKPIIIDTYDRDSRKEFAAGVDSVLHNLIDQSPASVSSLSAIRLQASILSNQELKSYYPEDDLKNLTNEQRTDLARSLQGTIRSILDEHHVSKQKPENVSL